MIYSEFNSEGSVNTYPRMAYDESASDLYFTGSKSLMAMRNATKARTLEKLFDLNIENVHGLAVEPCKK